MNKPSSFPNSIFATLFSFVLIFLTGHAFAACVNTQSVTENSPLDWSAWAVPVASSTAIIATTGATSGTGTRLYGIPAAGDYTVQKVGATACASVTFSITNLNCNAPGCTLSSFRGSWNGGGEQAFPIVSSTFPTLAGLTLLVGATATHGNTVTIGTKAPTFNIAIHYGANPDNLFAQTGVITFDSALSITTNKDINFGVVTTGVASTYRMSTAGVFSVPVGTGVQLSTSQFWAANLTIYGSATQTISISTGSFVNSAHVTLSQTSCSYNGGASGTCALSNQAAPSSSGKTLLIGCDAAVTAGTTAGTLETPSFTVTVTYT